MRRRSSSSLTMSKASAASARASQLISPTASRQSSSAWSNVSCCAQSSHFLLQLLEHVNQVPGDRVLLPVPQRPVHQLAMEPVRGPEGPERLGQLGQPVEALIAGERLEGIGAVALELLRGPGRSCQQLRHRDAEGLGQPLQNVE